MLNTLTRRIAPLLALTSLISCGKPITDSQAEKTDQTIEQQEPSSSIVFAVTGPLVTYRLNRSGQLRMLNALPVTGGNPSGSTVSIAYNVNPEDASDFEFRCVYVPNASGQFMVISHCVDMVGNNFGNVQYLLDRDHPMNQRRVIQVQRQSPDPSLSVNAGFQIQWI
jgi:hypothetical protein